MPTATVMQGRVDVGCIAVLPMYTDFAVLRGQIQIKTVKIQLLEVIYGKNTVSLIRENTVFCNKNTAASLKIFFS